jgi:uncharacterized protein (DUF1800 family)
MRLLRLLAPWVIGTFVTFGGATLGHAQPYSDSFTPDQQALHILNRIAYSPRPGDIERVKAIGIDRYVDQQLAPESIPESPALMRRLEALTTLNLSPIELFDRYEPHPILGRRPSVEEAKTIRQKARIILREAIEARLLRATQSERRLQQVMTDFWFNHFNIFAGKGLDRLWVGAFEEQAIRPNALGRFRDLLGATAKHPAMLFYLDNWQNTAPGSPGAKGKEQGLNENYAREIMELHTLGVDGGYSQDDVIALARIFTGWGLPQGLRLGRSNSNGFMFDPRRHDTGTKVFLGHTIKGAGMAEGEQALDILSRSSQTARHISFELAQYFIADQPDPALVDALTKRYLETDGDIREVMRTLLKSPQFWDAGGFDRKFKTPYEYIVSSVRLAGMPIMDVRPLAGMLAQLGMPLYGYQTPDGYKNTRDAWLNADAMTRRLNFATALGAGRTRIGVPPSDDRLQPGRNIPSPPVRAIKVNDGPRPLDADALIAALGHQLGAKTMTAIASAAPALKAGLVLGSPEFMNR